MSDDVEEPEVLMLAVAVKLLLELKLGVMEGLVVPLVLGELVILGLEDGVKLLL